MFYILARGGSNDILHLFLSLLFLQHKLNRDRFVEPPPDEAAACESSVGPSLSASVSSVGVRALARRRPLCLDAKPGIGWQNPGDRLLATLGRGENVWPEVVATLSLARPPAVAVFIRAVNLSAKIMVPTLWYRHCFPAAARLLFPYKRGISGIQFRRYKTSGLSNKVYK